MSFTHKFLNIALPLLTLFLLPIFILSFLLFKLVISLKKLVCPENLTRKVVIITGSASGIGEQLAYEYARHGAVLSLVDIRRDKLEAVAKKVRSLGSPDVITIGADVSKVEDCKRFVDETVNYFGHLDHLVNNAGIGNVVDKVEDCHDVSVLTPIMDINFWGALYGSLYAIPHLKRSKGKIVVIASTAGWFPLPKMSFYNASKAATINFFETLRAELSSVIGITIVTPGFIKTDIADIAYTAEPNFGIIPMESADECAKGVVKSVRRGDMYVTEPSWVKLVFPLKLFFPELLDFLLRLLFGKSSNTSGINKFPHISRISSSKAE